MVLAALILFSALGCKKAIPKITGESGITETGPQAQFYIYPAGAVANNGNNQQARVVIDAKVAIATNSNGANQQVRAQIISR